MSIHGYQANSQHFLEIDRMTPIAFEEKISKLALRNKLTITKSIDEKGQILGAENSQISVRNKLQNLDSISENGVKNNLKTVKVSLS